MIRVQGLTKQYGSSDLLRGLGAQTVRVRGPQTDQLERALAPLVVAAARIQVERSERIRPHSARQVRAATT